MDASVSQNKGRGASKELRLAQLSEEAFIEARAQAERQIEIEAERVALIRRRAIEDLKASETRIERLRKYITFLKDLHQQISGPQVAA